MAIWIKPWKPRSQKCISEVPELFLLTHFCFPGDLVLIECSWCWHLNEFAFSQLMPHGSAGGGVTVEEQSWAEPTRVYRHTLFTRCMVPTLEDQQAWCPEACCCEWEVGYSFLASSTTHFLNKLQVLLIIPRRVNFSHATLLFSVPLFKKREVQQSSIAYCQTSCDLDKPSYFPQQAWREKLFAEHFSAHNIFFHVLEFAWFSHNLMV